MKTTPSMDEMPTESPADRSRDQPPGDQPHSDDPAGHQSPGHQPPWDPAPATNVGSDRGDVISSALRQVAAWSLRFVIVAVAIGLFFYLLSLVWVGVLPVLMALLVTTVLWPAVQLLIRWGWPSALAAGVSLLLALGLMVVIGVVIVPGIVDQSTEVATQAGEGLTRVQEWLAGPPLNLASSQLEEFTGQAGSWLQGQAGGIASGFFSGVAAVGSALVTTILVLILTFLFLKDGRAFLPWLHRVTGDRIGQHLTEVSARVYRTLSSFIRTQALVGLIDAVLIATGLLILGVPLAFALAVLTFFAAFIPVVGAVVAGGFAVLVALVSNGPTTALFVLLIVLAVQQIEGNILLPMLQSNSMNVHAGIVLLALTIGGTLFGVVGAFLAVPVAASLLVILRYISEQIDLRTGAVRAIELTEATPEGQLAATRVERASIAGRRLLGVQRSDSGREPDDDDPGRTGSSAFGQRVAGAIGRRERKGD